MFNFKDQIDKKYESLLSYINGTFNQRVALPAETEGKIEEHKTNIEKKEADIKKIDTELRGTINTSLQSQTQIIKTSLEDLNNQIIASANKVGVALPSSPLDITAPEIDESLTPENLITTLRASSNQTFTSLNKYLQHMEENYQSFQKKIQEKKLEIDQEISDKTTEKKILDAEIAQLDKELSSLTTSPEQSSSNNATSSTPKKIISEIGEKNKELAPINAAIEQLQADKKALEEELNKKTKIEEQQQELSKVTKEIGDSITKKETELSVARKAISGYKTQKENEEEKLKKIQDGIVTRETKATETLRKALEDEQKAIIALEVNQDFIKNIETEQNKTLATFEAQKDAEAIKQLKLLHEQRLIMARDHIKVEGYEALERIEKAKSASEDITTVTGISSKIPTQAELDAKVKALRIAKGSTVTYHPGPMGSGGQLKMKGDSLLDAEEIGANAALLGWETISINTTDRKVRLAIAKEAFRNGIKDVNLNAPENDDSDGLKRLFMILKEVEPKFAKQNQFAKNSQSIYAMLYLELNDPIYSDGRRLQTLMIDILGPQKVALMLKDTSKQEDKENLLRDVVTSLKHQAPSVRKNFLEEIVAVEPIQLAKYFNTHLSEQKLIIDALGAVTVTKMLKENSDSTIKEALLKNIATYLKNQPASVRKNFENAFDVKDIALLVNIGGFDEQKVIIEALGPQKIALVLKEEPKKDSTEDQKNEQNAIKETLLQNTVTYLKSQPANVRKDFGDALDAVDSVSLVKFINSHSLEEQKVIIEALGPQRIASKLENYKEGTEKEQEDTKKALLNVIATYLKNKPALASEYKNFLTAFFKVEEKLETNVLVSALIKVLKTDNKHPYYRWKIGGILKELAESKPVYEKLRETLNEDSTKEAKPLNEKLDAIGKNKGYITPETQAITVSV